MDADLGYYEQKMVYTCHSCGKTFQMGMKGCAVLHAAGECCHYGDTEVVVSPKRADSLDEER